MNGHIIVPGEIAVDFWKKNAVKHVFLTHCHMDHMTPRMRSWKQKIYTSEINCNIVKLQYEVSDGLLVPLPLGVTCSMGEGTASFQVTAMDARHCPGSVILLFQGWFGTILYTGDFRYYPELLDEPTLQHVISGGGGVDKLYLDNTYCSPECDFPPRHQVLRDVIRFLLHSENCPVYVGVRGLGKEDALVSIAEALEVKVHVSQSRMNLIRTFCPSEAFTTEAAEARLHVVPVSRITHCARFEPPVVALLLTALFVGWPGPAPYSGNGVQVFPYSDHSSFRELCEFVRHVRPRQVVPVVQKWVSRGWFAERDLSPRTDMSVFRTYLTMDRPASAPVTALQSRPAGHSDLTRRRPAGSGCTSNKAGRHDIRAGCCAADRSGDGSCCRDGGRDDPPHRNTPDHVTAAQHSAEAVSDCSCEERVVAGGRLPSDERTSSTAGPVAVSCGSCDERAPFSKERAPSDGRMSPTAGHVAIFDDSCDEQMTSEERAFADGRAPSDERTSSAVASVAVSDDSCLERAPFSEERAPSDGQTPSSEENAHISDGRTPSVGQTPSDVQTLSPDVQALSPHVQALSPDVQAPSPHAQTLSSDAQALSSDDQPWPSAVSERSDGRRRRRWPEAGGPMRPCHRRHFTILDGQLVQLRRPLRTHAEVQDWLGSCEGAS